MYDILLVIHTLLVLFLIGIVLIQRSDSDGLSGMGGGGGGGNQFMTGRGSANLLTRTTAILAALFMVTSMILALMVTRMSEGSLVDQIEVPAANQSAVPTVDGSAGGSVDAGAASDEPLQVPTPEDEPVAAEEEPVVPKAE